MATSIEFQDVLEKMRLELRRGVIVIAVLGQLREEHYGYSLRKSLEDKGLPMDEGTLYPLIRRLQKQGLLDSEWRVESNRKKRFYQLNVLGLDVLTALSEEWQAMNVTIHRILD
ncbi:PadR family transcriptional regulator [Reinekea sp.]|jgi:PadR family transcriptional regulator PadR|uniref:PadR family transcriptional regulator n=1 Tax=Reinekea sp. TaxID=1970455 RepID=UPI00398A15BA